jgi:hypothetical protein
VQFEAHAGEARQHGFDGGAELARPPFSARTHEIGGDQRLQPVQVPFIDAFYIERPYQVAQRIGIPLAEISAALASLPEERTPTKADWTRLSSLWRRELDERIAQLTRLRDQLDDCIGCGCLSIEACKLRNPLDALAAQGSGPQRLQG